MGPPETRSTGRLPGSVVIIIIIIIINDHFFISAISASFAI